jgi:hypothetical protein
VRDPFGPNPGHRTEAEWRHLLSELVKSLSAHTGIRLVPTSWFVDDQPGYASAGGCADVRGVVNAALRLEACGVVCVSVNFGEPAWASADILLFSGGRRVVGPGGLVLVSLVFRLDGWSSQGWVADEYGEWESHSTDARWGRPELGAGLNPPGVGG